MKRSVIVALVLLAACSPQDDERSDGGSFSLSGTVIAVDAGVEVPDEADIDVQVEDDAQTGGDRGDDGRPEESGSISVKTDDIAGDCESDGGYTIYYTEETSIIPTEMVDDNFPDSTVSQQVDVTGEYTLADPDCVLVASSITVEGGGAPIGTFTPGPRPNGSPGEAASSP